MKRILYYLAFPLLLSAISCGHFKDQAPNESDSLTKQQNPPILNSSEPIFSLSHNSKSDKNSIPIRSGALKLDDPNQNEANSNKAQTSIPKKPHNLSKKIEQLCGSLDEKFRLYGWPKEECENRSWHHVRDSVEGRPLIWMSYGNEKKHRKKHKDTTLVLCGVHGDEITPIKFCFDIMNFVEKNIDLYTDKMIVIAPVVNPDSFFKRYPTRTNYNNIDINRNFPTNDWRKDAVRLWKNRYRSDKRRNPGVDPMSEPEVLFQVNLIKRYRPNKIISVHAPLTMIDYDGPTFSKNSKNNHDKQTGPMADKLLRTMSEKASDYRIKNYRTYPGSLGRYAGKERNIPTYTLELPSSDSRQSKKYWDTLKESIHHAFLHDLRPIKSAAMKMALKDTLEKNISNNEKIQSKNMN